MLSQTFLQNGNHTTQENRCAARENRHVKGENNSTMSNVATVKLDTEFFSQADASKTTFE